MTEFSTGQLQQMQADADNMLDAILKSVTMSRRLQSAIRSILKADGDAVDVFEALASESVESRGQANELLVAAVGALANLQTSQAVKSELRRRAEGN